VSSVLDALTKGKSISPVSLPPESGRSSIRRRPAAIVAVVAVGLCVGVAGARMLSTGSAAVIEDQTAAAGATTPTKLAQASKRGHSGPKWGDPKGVVPVQRQVPKPPGAGSPGLPPLLPKVPIRPKAAAAVLPPALPDVVAPVKKAVPADVVSAPPADAPAVQILFIQWTGDPASRIASLRLQGGALAVVHEGEVVEGMAVAGIDRAGVRFTWRGETFLLPVHRY